MTFIAELENIIRALYLAIINQKYPQGVHGKTIRVTFGEMVVTIKSVLIDGSNRGLSVLDIANNIIYRLLQEKFFVHENPQAALQIGYVYLKRQGVTITNYSVDAITNNSTIADIQALTATW
jgi:prophage maintenance system killer protein